MPQPFTIPFQNFEQGRFPVPIKGSFFASIGLNPFLEKGRLISKFQFNDDAKSSVLTTLKDVASFVVVSSALQLAFNGADGHISAKVSGSWADLKTNGNGGHKGAFLAPDSATPANKVVYYISGDKVGRAVTPYASGNFTDTWYTLSPADGVPRFGTTVRDWALITNGRYIAGWKFSTGGAEVPQSNLLDFQTGYESFKIMSNKSAGVRLVYIACKYASDRSRDGVFVWDLNATAPIDFIPVPWISDIYVSGGNIWAIYGNQLTLTILDSNGPVEANKKEILDKLIVNNTYMAVATFLGRWGPFLLLAVSGDHQRVGWYGEAFYHGVWCYHIDTGALFYWMPPYSGDLSGVVATAMYTLGDNDLEIAMTVTDASGSRYYIESLGGIDIVKKYELLELPTIGGDNPRMKHWDKLTFSHKNLSETLTSFRIELWVRDFKRESSYYGETTSGAMVSATNTTFVFANGDDFLSGIQIGDMIRVTKGTGAGQVRMITNIVVGATNTTYTIDRAWDTNPATASSCFEWRPYALRDVIDNDSEDLDQKELNIDMRSVRMRMALVLSFTRNSRSDILQDGLELINLVLNGEITT